MLVYRCDECGSIIEKADMREDHDGCHLCPSCFREWEDNEIAEEEKPS